MKIGVFFDHIHNAALQTGKSVEQCLQACRLAGVDGVEFDYDTLKDDIEYEKIKTLLKQSDLAVSGVYYVYPKTQE